MDQNNKTGNSQSAPAEGMQLEIARSRLTAIWLAGSGVMFAVLVLQSIMGKYGGRLQQVWSWFIPTVLPSLSLMLGVLGASAFGKTDAREVRKDYYGFTRWLSIAYLTVLLMTILLEPFGPQDDPTQLFAASNYWLTPLQGLVVGSIGVLFTANEKGSARRRQR